MLVLKQSLDLFTRQFKLMKLLLIIFLCTNIAFLFARANKSSFFSFFSIEFRHIAEKTGHIFNQNYFIDILKSRLHLEIHRFYRSNKNKKNCNLFVRNVVRKVVMIKMTSLMPQVYFLYMLAIHCLRVENTNCMQQILLYICT